MIDSINEILHPTDFSDPAQNAFTYAHNIARKNNCPLNVMHSAKPPYTYGSEQMMVEMIDHREYQDVSLETNIELGDTVSNILESPGDLIVMGSTGKTNMGKILFGSISSEVILKSPVPVLVVPADQPYSDFNHFIFATDYNDRDLINLGYLTEWAELFDAEITVLHIAEQDNLEARVKFRGFKELANDEIDYPHINFSLTFEKDFYNGISAILHGQEDVLIVMTRYKKSFFESFLEKDHIQQTIYTEVPLLVLPGEEELGES